MVNFVSLPEIITVFCCMLASNVST